MQINSIIIINRIITITINRIITITITIKIKITIIDQGEE
jgi:hypothetical protein